MGNGEWRCKYGHFHDAGEKCDCEEGQNKDSAADQSKTEPE